MHGVPERDPRATCCCKLGLKKVLGAERPKVTYASGGLALFSWVVGILAEWVKWRICSLPEALNIFAILGNLMGIAPCKTVIRSAQALSPKT